MINMLKKIWIIWSSRLQYWYYQNLPVSAILVQILVNTSIPVSSRIFQYLLLEDTGHCQNMSIADTGRFWEILVIPELQILEDSEKILVIPVFLLIPVLQILEDSRKYWLYQYCRYWKILVIPVLQILEDSGKYWLYHRRSWHGLTTPLFLTFCLQIYFQ